MNDRLQAQLAFLLEADKLKEIQRRSYLLSGSRVENSAEHSWHLALMAIVLAEHANTPIDPLKTMRMLVVHDLVEIDAGDTFCYDVSGNESKPEREQQAASRLFGLLPDEQGREMRALWEEFEARETNEAKFAAALDRLMPVLHNLHTGCRSWREHGVTTGQIYERNSKIADGSATVWEWLKGELEYALREASVPSPDPVAAMQDYYRKRAPIYDQSMGYDQPETVRRQARVIDYLEQTLAGRTVLEIACGPCFWTQSVARKTKALLATDFNPETLEEAKKKDFGIAQITFQTADAYHLPAFERLFDAAMAIDWFCHVPARRRIAFLEGLHERLEPAARIVFCDQLPKETPENTDGEGNCLQDRSLPDGSRHTVIKNFPTESEMRELLSPYAAEIEFRSFPEARRWTVAYTLESGS